MPHHLGPKPRVVLGTTPSQGSAGPSTSSSQLEEEAMEAAPSVEKTLLAKYSRTVNLIPHPQVPGVQIALLADVPHLIKNLNGHLVRGQTITLPANVVAANGLPCSTVSLEPVRQLAEFQKNLTFKLAPKLRPELLDPNHFEKMK
ncbi:hypothetical protein HPB47_014521, partial [Ixodes persulcatus]